MTKRRICVVTGSRADYGLLLPLMRAIGSSATLSLQVIATGMHLAPEFGLTVQAIEADGIPIDQRVEMLVSSDTRTGIVKSMGLGMIGFADAFARLDPHMVLVLGDRYEILAAAQAAMLANLPLAHLCGGDVTLGAVDESIRHAITKMAQLHFPSNAQSAARIRQMGENPDHIHCVGSTSLDLILSQPRLSRAQLEAELGFDFRPRNMVVTFHPVTLDQDDGGWQLTQLLAALAALPDQMGQIITLPNADTGGRRFTRMVQDFAANRPHVSVHASLGQKRYYSLLAQVDLMVGNSSSGLSEAPSFGIATINIGDRQEGRLKAASVIDCPADTDAILAAIQTGLANDYSATVNPYGDGQASQRIVQILDGLDNPRSLLHKPFFTMDMP